MYKRAGTCEDSTFLQDHVGDVVEDGGERKAVALVNQAERMIDALNAHHSGQREEARTILSELRDDLRNEAPFINDPAFESEITLVEALLALI